MIRAVRQAAFLVLVCAAWVVAAWLCFPAGAAARTHDAEAQMYEWKAWHAPMGWRVWRRMPRYV